MSDWPAAGETTPLVFSLRMKSGFRALTRQSMWALFKDLFAHAHAVLSRRDPEGAANLLSASTHWMRHTAATDMLNAGADLRTVQAILGHESIATTSNYSHAEDIKIHRDIDGKHGIDWTSKRINA